MTNSTDLSKRHAGIDAYRVFAFACVVILHAIKVPMSHDPNINSVFNYFIRWAVPFFFLTTGFFMGHSHLGTMGGLAKLMKRLVPIQVFWIFVYMVFFDKLYALKRPDVLLSYMFTGGSSFHLWFISALGISAGLVYLLRDIGWARLIFIGIVLYILGLAFGPYRSVLSLPEIPWHGHFKTRWGPFLGFLLVSLGYYIAKTGRVWSFQTGLLMALAGLAIQFMEGLGLWFAGQDFASYDYLAGTALFGLGVFIMALNSGDNKFIRFASKYGFVTLGAYCIHLIFIEFLFIYFDETHFGQGLVISLLAFLLSIFSSVYLAKIPYLRRVIR